MNEILMKLLCELIQKDAPLVETDAKEEPYVVVRCRDAGVHAGYLESYSGRECTLRESRRLWYWKPADDKSFLSGVAVAGLDSDSKVGAPVRITLTENCEILYCTEQAAISIRAAKEHVQ